MASLTIAGQSLDIPGAWQHNRSLRRLRSTVRSRGDNRVVPSAAGTTAYAVRRTEVVVGLELMVFGGNDAAGTPHADLVAGLDANLAFLDDWAADRMDGTTATWAGSYLAPNGTTYTADVQLLNWEIAQENVTQVLIAYDLRIPSGIWV